MDHLLLALVLLSVCVFKSVDTAPTKTEDRALTSSFEGTIADIEYLEDHYSGDQWENCDSDDYQCDNDECIPSSYRCDRVFDCEDYSDELYCGEKIIDPVTATIGESSTMSNLLQTTEDTEDFTFRDQWENCDSHEYQCDNDECIPSSHKCDGVYDCEDNSDELDCGASRIIETTVQSKIPDCTRSFNLSAGDKMSLTTPNFPKDYGSFLSCLWTFSAPDNAIIRVIFLSFQTESLYDDVSAGTGLGPQTGRTVISRHSGDELPRSFSGSPNVWIRFRSDITVEYFGFLASISAYLPSTIIKTTVQSKTPDCTRSFNLSAGDTMSLTTPNFPKNYESFLSCLWTISAPDNVIIRVAFLSFHTETFYDVMSAGSGLGPETGRTVISRYSGDELPRSFSGSPNVWISFTSDGLIEGVGFSARISAYLQSTEASMVTNATIQTSDCHGRFNLSVGSTLTLTTPNFPDHYDSFLSCLWTTSVPDDVIIRVHFNSFETEDANDVMSAGLGLKPETGTTVISRHSGAELPKSFSGSPNVWISFTSDGSIEASGFFATLTAYQDQLPTTIGESSTVSNLMPTTEHFLFTSEEPTTILPVWCCPLPSRSPIRRVPAPWRY